MLILLPIRRSQILAVMQFNFEVSHSHRGFSAVGYRGFGYEETVSTVFLRSFGESVKTAAWIPQRLPITGLKPRCE